MMKNTIAWLPLVAVVGGIVGAWGPYEELRAYKERPQVQKAEERAARRAGFDPISQLIKVPDAAKRPRREKRPAAKPGPAERDVAEAPTNAPAAAAAERPSGAAVAHRPGKMLPPEDLQARIDEAAELWRTRIHLARAKALEALGIPEDGAESFDASLAAMNDRLRESVQAMADSLVDDEAMTPELGIRLMGDISVALAETYDQIGACVDPSKRAAVSEMQLVEFIDPSVAEPLVAVKDKLDGRALGGGRSGK